MNRSARSKRRALPWWRRAVIKSPVLLTPCRVQVIKIRIATVATVTDSVIVRLEKAAILRVIHQEPAFSEMFIAHLLSRAIRVEADLVDQLFDSSEKRLARLLLLLANFGKDEKPEPILAKISQETAEMIGTTRSRVSFFMNKFRKLGLIDYNGCIEVHSSLLFCTTSRISTLKWALSSDTPEIAHIARREVAYREVGALIDSIQLPPRDAFISTPTSPPAEIYYSKLLHELSHNADIGR